jgi:ubiquinone/menaquinone biosynthesis C-methylase UbiE
MLSSEDLKLIRCPDCLGRLSGTGAPLDERPRRDSVICRRCGTRWPFRKGFARLYRESRVRGNDRLLRRSYNLTGRLHDPLVRYLLPMLGAGKEDPGREAYVDRIRLEDIEPPAERPLRILEVGVGAGANLPRVLGRFPAGERAELWGLDLSHGMLGECRRKVARKGITSPNGSHVRLFLADAHALPFPDHSFDRVFHVGGIGGFRHPAGALAEMARVARPGTPIVVVDEALDEKRSYNALQRLAFRAITFYEEEPKSPAHLIPEDCEVLEDTQISPFFYCLSFSRSLTRSI